MILLREYRAGLLLSTVTPFGDVDAPELPVYRTTPLSKFTFIARSSSARNIPDSHSIVGA
jgi:hypothetical protein